MKHLDRYRHPERDRSESRTAHPEEPVGTYILKAQEYAFPEFYDAGGGGGPAMFHAPVLSPADLAQARETQVQTRRDAYLAQEDARFWLRLAWPPYWTPRLLGSVLARDNVTRNPGMVTHRDPAEAASRPGQLPTDLGGIDDLIQRCEHLDILERFETLPGLDEIEAPDPADDRIELLPQARAFILEKLDETPGQIARLTQEAMSVAEHLLAANPAILTKEPRIARWAELAKYLHDVNGFREFLRDRLIAAMDRDDLTAAMAWMREARALAEPLGGRLAPAVEGNARYLELRQRTQDDERRLCHFLEREEQIAAFDRLLDGHGDSNDPPWSLHYVGPGGIGKTMLVRHLVSRHVPRLGGVAARIDFDFLDPDYPVRRPGLLLEHLAEELRLKDTESRSEENYYSFSTALIRFNEWLTGEASEQERERPLETGWFSSLLDAFAGMIRNLPEPVVLVLDTCEELARPGPTGKPTRAIADTFAIFDQLRDMTQHFVLVLAGRRLLAGSGHGWTRIGDPTHEGLPERRHLCLHEIRGFRRGEAERYLNLAGVSAKKMRRTILNRCETDARHAVRIRFDKSATSEKNVRGKRYHPFELDLYAKWVREDPAMNPERLTRSGSDRYVEERIDGRLRHPELRRWMPVISMLTRFDDEMLRAALGMSRHDEGFDAIFQELARQEWILRADGFLGIQPLLRERLRRFYHERSALVRDRARSRLIPHLMAWLERIPVASIHEVQVTALFELTAGHAELQLQAWRTLRGRLIAAKDWSRLSRLADRLCTGPLAATEGAPATAVPPARLLVLADYVAATRHLQLVPDALSFWQLVLSGLPVLAEGLERERLRIRALAGLVVGVALNHGDTTALSFSDSFCYCATECLEGPEGFWDDDMMACAIATCEHLVEIIERQRENEFGLHRIHTSLAPLLAGLRARATAPVLQTYAEALRVRASLWQDPPPETAEAFRGWWAKAEALPAETHAWLDWPAPKNLRTKLKLEALFHGWPRFLDSSWILDRCAFKPDLKIRDTARDRLQSLLGRIHITLSQSAFPIRDTAIAFVKIKPEDVPSNDQYNSLRRIPPLVLTLIEGGVSLWNPNDVLTPLLKKAVSLGLNHFWVTQAEHLQAKLALPSPGSLSVGAGIEPPDLDVGLTPEKYSQVKDGFSFPGPEDTDNGGSLGIEPDDLFDPDDDEMEPEPPKPVEPTQSSSPIDAGKPPRSGPSQAPQDSLPGDEGGGGGPQTDPWQPEISLNLRVRSPIWPMGIKDMSVDLEWLPRGAETHWAHRQSLKGADLDRIPEVLLLPDATLLRSGFDTAPTAALRLVAQPAVHHWPPWERFMWQAFDRAARQAGKRDPEAKGLEIVRLVEPERPPQTAPATYQDFSGIFLLCDDKYAMDLTAAEWDQPPFQLSHVGSLDRPPDTKIPRSVVHLIGRPFELAEEVGFSPHFESKGMSKQRAAQPGEWFDAGELSRWFPETALFVLQLPPTYTTPDPRATALMRVLGAHLTAQSGGQVIVVPPLPMDASGNAARSIATSLRAWMRIRTRDEPWNDAHACHLTSALKQDLMTLHTGTKAPADDPPLAWEVTLFAADPTPPRSRS
ncbi:ATP-binding protein [Sulfidibacter corallicola]|uniref:ATP-binding protein n=1 Tax=Sulfidibacter corallicola TaxID=2818388 RepID=A0A8A4TKS3_SULCO|nr:ATP-binding protein [Sulfidibacter corallicola]QTD50077.1 ATP-binding protein [Sulfidibacter corallicola]